MTTATDAQARHDALVEAILNCPAEYRGNVPGLLLKLAEEFPDTSHDAFVAALIDAADELDARAARYQSQHDDMMRLAPLFDGMPPGTSLGECARVKAERGDPLALAFFEWEKRQAGGVQ